MTELFSKILIFIISTFSTPILGMGNSMYFGDPMMTGGQYLTSIVAGGLIGGGFNGITALANGRTFMSGAVKPPALPPPTPTVRPSLPSPNSSKPEVNTNGMRGGIKGESITIRSTTIQEPLQPGLIRANIGNELRYMDAKGGSNVLLNTSKQLQAKFKHAGDFDIVGNYSKSNAARFSSSINQHINSPDIKVIQGTYHKQPAIHYLNPNTGLNVITTPNGQFWSGWKLSPAQLENVLKHGGL